MKRITFDKGNHKGEEVLTIGFAYDTSVKADFKAFKGVRWSQTLKSFYLAYSKENVNALYTFLRARDYFIG